MAVVAALDLDDQVATGDGAHQVHGVHRRLGAGVGEAPQRQVEPARQFGGHPDRVLGRLREVRAAAHPLGHRRDDRRVRVSGDRRAVPAVHVDVLGAVDVVDLRARRRGSSTPPAAGRSASSTSPRRRGARAPARSTRRCAAGGAGRPASSRCDQLVEPVADVIAAVVSAGETTLEPPLSAAGR